MKAVLAVIGVILILGGVCLGLYAGIWWAFIGGIVAIIEAIKADPVPTTDLAFGIARVFFAGFIGWITVVVCVGIGSIFLKAAE